jgi:hypothetical protein
MAVPTMSAAEFEALAARMALVFVLMTVIGKPPDCVTLDKRPLGSLSRARSARRDIF